MSEKEIPSRSCPSCGKEMLEMPCFESQYTIMEYYLCIDCDPHVRVIKKCKWIWNIKGLVICAKADMPCDPSQCPQIEEWNKQ